MPVLFARSITASSSEMRSACNKKNIIAEPKCFLPMWMSPAMWTIPDIKKAMPIWMFDDHFVPGLNPSDRATYLPMDARNYSARGSRQCYVQVRNSYAYTAHHLVPESPTPRKLSMRKTGINFVLPPEPSQRVGLAQRAKEIRPISRLRDTDGDTEHANQVVTHIYDCVWCTHEGEEVNDAQCIALACQWRLARRIGGEDGIRGNVCLRCICQDEESECSQTTRTNKTPTTVYGEGRYIGNLNDGKEG